MFELMDAYNQSNAVIRAIDAEAGPQLPFANWVSNPQGRSFWTQIPQLGPFITGPGAWSLVIGPPGRPPETQPTFY